MRIPNVSADAIGEVVESLSQRQPLTEKEVAHYIGKSERYTSRALIAAEELGLIRKDINEFTLLSSAYDLAKAKKDSTKSNPSTTPEIKILTEKTAPEFKIKPRLIIDAIK